MEILEMDPWNQERVPWSLGTPSVADVPPAGPLPAWLGTQLRPQGHSLVLLGECALLVFGATSPHWGHPGACPSPSLGGCGLAAMAEHTE